MVSSTVRKTFCPYNSIFIVILQYPFDCFTTDLTSHIRQRGQVFFFNISNLVISGHRRINTTTMIREVEELSDYDPMQAYSLDYYVYFDFDPNPNEEKTGVRKLRAYHRHTHNPHQVSS
eukprot:UN20001